jgi:large subunit ribosomal protein L15
MRDEIKKIPKLRGYKFASIQNEFYPINLDSLENAYSAGDTVTLESLIAKKVVRVKGGNNPRVKILARGTLSKKLTIKGCTMSATAKAAVEKVGGAVEA